MPYPEILPPELMPPPARPPAPAPRAAGAGRSYRGAREILPPPGDDIGGGLPPQLVAELQRILSGTEFLGPVGRAAVQPPMRTPQMLAELLSRAPSTKPMLMGAGS